MCSSRRYDSQDVASNGEDDEIGFSFHLAYCLSAFFSIVAPTVYAFQAALVLKDPRGIVEIKAALFSVRWLFASSHSNIIWAALPSS
jgi:hypothetical protein